MSTTIAGYCRGYDPSYDLLNYSSRDDGVVTFAKFKDTRSTLRLKSNVVKPQFVWRPAVWNDVGSVHAKGMFNGIYQTMYLYTCIEIIVKHMFLSGCYECH